VSGIFCRTCLTKETPFQESLKLGQWHQITSVRIFSLKKQTSVAKVAAGVAKHTQINKKTSQEGKNRPYRKAGLLNFTSLSIPFLFFP
jgi:hypothetical protein